MDNKKQEIVKIANALFSRKGYSNTTVEEIAKEAGMAKASLYKMFSGKEELLFESMLQFSERIENGLMRIADHPTLSPKEKLSQCIQLYMDAICDNNFHLLMISFADVITFENASTKDVGFTIRNTFDMWLTETLVYVYGESIQFFAKDIAFILRSIVSEYVKVVGSRMNALSSVNSNVFIAFIESIVDICVCGIMERKEEYAPLWDISERLSEGGGLSPFNKMSKAKTIIRRIEAVISEAALTEAEKNDYYQITIQLNEEIPGFQDSAGLLKAYLYYLEQLPELQDSCNELRALYGL